MDIQTFKMMVATIQQLDTEGRLYRPDASPPAASSTAPGRTKVLRRQFAGRADPKYLRFEGLPPAIKVPERLQTIINRRLYRDIEYACGAFYVGAGPEHGFYGWPLMPFHQTYMAPELGIGRWEMSLAFTYAPDDQARVGVVMSLEEMAGRVTPLEQLATIEAFTMSGTAAMYKLPLAYIDGSVRSMLQAGYYQLPDDQRHAVVRDAIGL